jgi:hypothetical protein
VSVVLRRRGAPARVDSITLRFGTGGTLAESEGLPAGVYDVAVPGGAALLAVSASREMLPQQPTVAAGAIGGTARAGEQPRLRDRWWPYVLALGALCAEWLARRRLGLR